MVGVWARAGLAFAMVLIEYRRGKELSCNARCTQLNELVKSSKEATGRMLQEGWCGIRGELWLC
jgi:hypothetical protein